MTAILLLPLALEMVLETVTVHNFFSAFGGVPYSPEFREGRLRAQGPFAHSILAGTVGGVCLPLTVGLWRFHRTPALFGVGACIVMVLASASSGPIMTTLAAIVALIMWRFRHKMPLVRWLALLTYIGLELVMKAPAYYIIARIDITSGSTGYHRAALIESAIIHLREWWLFGTDYTRHWMPTGVSWSPDHTDITNQYLVMGIMGGLALVVIFVAIFVRAFSFVGKAIRETNENAAGQKFFLWTLGASLFAHLVTCISVSYFDQSFVFLYLAFAAIGSARFSQLTEKSPGHSQLIQQPLLARAFSFHTH